MYMGYAYSRGRDSISIHRSPDQGETDPNQYRELCVSPGNPNTSSLMLFSWDFGDGFTVEWMSIFCGKDSDSNLWLTRKADLSVLFAKSFFFLCLLVIR